MALLQRTRILPNERLDLQDYNNIENFVCADFKAIHKNVWSDKNFVMSGFEASGTGTNTLSVVLADSEALVGDNDGTMFIGAPALAALSTTNLIPSATNFVEIFIEPDTGGADSRAFWDSTAAGGQGAEFSQIIDTFSFLKATFAINTSNFTGDPDKIRICEVDVNSGGVITAIRDARNLFWRLGRSGDATFDYSWNSRTEPPTSQFTGADKDIKNFKDWADAVMTSIKEIKGSTYWYEFNTPSLPGSFRALGLSVVTALSSSAKLSWSGTALSITDDSGLPLNADALAAIRLFDSLVDIRLTRQDGAGGSSTIPIADGDILWVELPDPLASVDYTGVGVLSTNYRVTARGSVPMDDSTFWLAFREGSRLYFRGIGEFEAGESHQVSDETSRALATFLGFNPETATVVPYTAFPNLTLPFSYASSDSLVTAISTNTKNINYIDDLLNENPYEEVLDVVSGAPASDNEVTGPVIAGTSITIPLDSRDANSVEQYIVGRGELMVYLNGIHMSVGVDYTEVGAVDTASSQIQMLFDLVVGDQLVFRNALAAGMISVAGGGSTSLQDAYDNGNTITTTSGNPFTVTGPSGKIAVFNGDIDVTGVIDPKGLVLDRQSVKPFDNSQDGLWVNSSGEFVYSQAEEADVNISQVLGGSATTTAVEVPLLNNTGGVLAKLTPVRINASGQLDSINVSQETQALATVGVATAGINNGASGNITTMGRLTDITTTAVFGDILYVSKTGGVTNVKPSIGVAGFISGDFIIRLGVISQNQNNPLLKDLLVNVSIVGQL